MRLSRRSLEEAVSDCVIGLRRHLHQRRAEAKAAQWIPRAGPSSPGND